ncbi:hypothetical protein V1499_07025 [Neobacillus sp. SCS-31]|uniref:hypothetical protein n=1 Tax=Neobacillus oceani TaxID=3115292 RepID=UPI003905A245
MKVNIKDFIKINVVDTCSIWNLISSFRFYNASKKAGCHFSCTAFIMYECLYKPRKSVSETEQILIGRLKGLHQRGEFKEYHIEIDDLQDVDLLKKRKNLSKGELSGIAFAKKINQAFITDDQGARLLAEQVMPGKMVQTIPHLFGWLFFNEMLIDSDKDEIINEHKYFNRPLSKYLEDTYTKALELKLASKY